MVYSVRTYFYFMNAPHSKEPNDSLSRTLADWRVTPERAPEFRAAVWARIGEEKAPLPWAVYARRNAAAVAGAMALAAVLGGVVGKEQARAKADAASARLAAAYVQGLDARAMVGR